MKDYREKHKGPSHNDPNRNSSGQFIKGAQRPKEWIEIQRLKTAGELNSSWKGGVTQTNEKIRKSNEYSNWRKSIFIRDNFTCVRCKKTGVVLNADHFLPFARYPTEQLHLENGRTLCVECHRIITSRWLKNKLLTII